LLKVDVAKTTVEKHFTGIEFEVEAQLLVVNVVISPQIQESVIEVSQRLLEVAHEEVGHALLEVCNGKVLIQPHSALVALNLILLSALFAC
jgi:hypothetical protein